jgi:hypothetical protein
MRGRRAPSCGAVLVQVKRGVCPGEAKRNGARHCCQAPLRRAKDLPVFATWSSNPKAQRPVLDPGAPAQASLPITAVQRPGSLFGSAPERASPPNSPPHLPEGFSDLDVPRPFLDWAPSTRPVSLGGKPPSSKEAPALPAPLADWSGNPFAASSPREAVQLRTSFHRLPAEIGPSVTLRDPSCRCRPSGEAGTSVPITN